MMTRARLRRWHVWLGWIIALPILFWVVSGLIMVAKPIEEVRGSHLLAEPRPMRMDAPMVMPNVEGRAIASMKLESRAPGPRWVLHFADGGARLGDPATGALLPLISAADAVREVTTRYTGKASVAGATRTSRNDPPLDLRRPIDTWQVRMSDGTHFYVDLGSGEIVARRTRWWRLFDFMFGLHIMDLETREDTSNPLIIGFAVVALAMSLLALILLPLTINRRGRKVIRPD